MVAGAAKEFRGPRRVWTPRQEQGLLLAMKEIIRLGWKCENRFRLGYLKALDQEISGFGWDDETNVVVMEDDIWETYVKATGEGVEDFVQVTQSSANRTNCKSPDNYVPQADNHLTNLFGEDIYYYNTTPLQAPVLGMTHPRPSLPKTASVRPAK
ncbi:hypothetical protein Salat_1150700 [Sesamum alatum]|uniref:Myb/SANT-like domain-containing protein n=1 Tax=Sesamum alatum TaxID=300844 RepID=A0AAE2CNC6_9LAMI|nr:hypothetical protein Salat_1150700 [Sesamum alatum]